jgi:hypothetical protein
MTKNTIIADDGSRLELLFFDPTDRLTWKKLFDQWNNLNKYLQNEFESRGINLPEGISESAFCMWSNNKSGKFISKTSSGKKLKTSSFDTYNITTNRSEQIKACSIENDLTSFGPKSDWDDLYFLDFYNHGKLDGVFDIYKIQDSIIYNAKLNSTQTFKDQQKQGRRPRLSIKQLIEIHGIEPLAQGVCLWITQ